MGMGRFLLTAASAVVSVLLMLVPAAAANHGQQKSGKKEKSVRKDVMSFDGGIFFETDGSLSDITCFRVSGRATAPQFFDGLKRIDDAHGTHYQREREVVAEFPEELTISLVMFDFPCPGQLEKPGPRRYLTKDMMLSLRFSFYWKRNLELRHIENLKQVTARAEPIEPYNTEIKEDLPKRYRWFLDFDIPSGSVPLTDRVVLVIRTADGRTAARVAARL
jgi:hypothetical protein